MDIRTATLDTNVFPAQDLIDRAARAGIEAAVITVSARELSGSSLETALSMVRHVREIAVVGESIVGEAVVGSDADEQNYEVALTILSNGAFPGLGDRDGLAPGQLRQLRDAMILCAHVASGRDVLVSNDQRAFVRNGRKEAIETGFGTKVMTVIEFETYLAMRQPSAVRDAANSPSLQSEPS